MSGADTSSWDGGSAIKPRNSPGSYSSSGGGMFDMLGGASLNNTGPLGASTLDVMSSMGRFSAANSASAGELLMYLSNTLDSSKTRVYCHTYWYHEQ